MLICTEPFLPVARREAEQAGLPQLPLLSIVAGFRELPEDARQALADTIADQALRAVASDARGPR